MLNNRMRSRYNARLCAFRLRETDRSSNVKRNRTDRTPKPCLYVSRCTQHVMSRVVSGCRPRPGLPGSRTVPAPFLG